MRILVVEDREAAGPRHWRTGSRGEGFAVDVAHGRRRRGSGTPGRNTYDAILLDIMLPVLQRLQGVRDAASPRKIWTPILMLTAKDGDWDQIEALDTGADDYVHQAILLHRAARPAAFAAAARRRHREAGQPGGRRPSSWILPAGS